jgi:transcription antitermination factor NusG
MWILSRTTPGAEFIARRRLEEVGIYAWVPVFRKKTHPRYRRKPKIVVLPLLASYAFICTEDAGKTRMIIRERVSSVRFVSAGQDRGPLEFGYRDVNDLMRREDAGEFDQIDFRKPVNIRVGDLVFVVNDGPFHGKQGHVTARRREDRFEVRVANLKIQAAAHHLQLVSDGPPPNGHGNGASDAKA